MSLPYIGQTGVGDGKEFITPEVGGAKFAKVSKGVVDDATFSTGLVALDALIIVTDKTNHKVGFWLAENKVLTAIEADASFSTTLTTDAKINVAFDSDQYVVEPNLFSTIDIAVTVIAI